MAKNSLLKYSVVIIIVAGTAALFVSTAHSRAKENRAKLPQAATSRDADRVKSDTAKANTAKTDAVGGEKKKAGQYWLGVRCIAPIPEMVRTHVEVPEDSGVFVADIVPEGPAAKAGVARHDILLATGAGPLKKVSDLIAATARSQGKPLTLEILRDGKRKSIEITPQQRPAEFEPKGSLSMPPGSKWHKLGKWFDESHPGTNGRPPLRMQFMHPGIILPPGTRNHPPLPTDMEQAIQSRTQKQLDAVNRQIKQLNKLVEDLRQERLLFNKQKQAGAKAGEISRPDKK